MSELDKAEYQRIEAAIRATEQMMIGNPHIRQDAVAALLEPSKGRLHQLDHNGTGLSADVDNRKKQASDSIAIAVLVMQETQLNSAEKEIYGSFLQQDHFSRDDFGKLDEFYTDGGAWDRLSENGKKNMSERFWKGVEQGQYTLQEAPQNVRNKETDQLAFYIQNPDKAPEAVQRMSPAVKADFMTAHESGNKEAAREILNSKPLFESSTNGKTQAAAEHSEVALGREAEDKAETLTQNQGSAEELEDRASDIPKLASFDELPSTSPTQLPAAGGSSGRTPST